MLLFLDLFTDPLFPGPLQDTIGGALPLGIVNVLVGCTVTLGCGVSPRLAYEHSQYTTHDMTANRACLLLQHSVAFAPVCVSLAMPAPSPSPLECEDVQRPWLDVLGLNR